MPFNLPWQKLSPSAKRGLLAHALHWMAVQMGMVFMGVYLFKLGGGYRLPAINALGSYVAIPLAYWWAAMATRRWGVGASYRTGLAIYVISQALILALGEAAGKHAFSLGFLWGLGVGFYWQAWVLLMVDLSDERSDRDAMLGSNQAAFFLASLTATPMAGWFLTLFEGTRGYPYVFASSLLLFVLAWMVSLPLKGKPHHGGSALGRLLRVRKPKGWNAGIFSAALMGFLSVGALFLPMLISYETGGNEGHGGNYTAFNALAGLFAAYQVARLGHPERRASFLLWSALAVALLTLPLALHRGYNVTLLYGLGMAVAMSVFNVPLFAAHIRIIESSRRFSHRRADAMLLREVPLNVGRALAACAVLWGVSGLNSPMLSLLLACMALAPLLNFMLMRPHLSASQERR